MPQSKHNVNVCLSRDVHASLLEILKNIQDDTRKKTGIAVTFTLGDVIKMLADSYESQ